MVKMVELKMKFNYMYGGEEMVYEKLHKNSKKSWFIARIIWAVIISTIIFIIRKVLLEELNLEELNSGFEFLINIISLVVIGGSLLNAIVYPIIEYKQWKYCIDEDKIEFSEGIFFVKTIFVPIVRIQHVEIKEGPINRILKLADVIINTAGGSHKIPNLEINKAKDIGLYLNNKVKKKVEDLNEKIIEEKEEENV